MRPKLPRTPFSTPFSSSKKMVEARIRGIIDGPQKRPPLPLLLLVFAFCFLSVNLVSCQPAQTKDDPDESAASVQDAVPAEPNVSPLPQPDLNQNGVPEEIRLENEYGGVEIRFYENGQLILREIPDVYLCRLDGTDYILRCYPDEYQGDFRYSYSLSRFDGEFEEVQQWNEVRFDANFNALFHREFDPETIAAFVEELNDLLSHSVRLSVRDGALLAEDARPVELDWLDSFPDVFVRDPNKTLLENLKNFRAAMPQDLTPPAAVRAVTLPDQSYAMMFCSGAGAWQTTLTLQGDGHFEGHYEDADMSTHYVCQFHGRFGNIVQISDASFYMTLEEVVLDTKRPMGGEWDEGGIHYISSAPYGLTGADGEALEPGAGFIFYLPEATGHAPGTELYGATDFLSWLPDRSRRFNGFKSASDTLDCYGLYNLEIGCGFFDLHAWNIA